MKCLHEPGSENKEHQASLSRTDLAGLAGPLGGAQALKAVLQVHAGSPLGARAGGALVCVWNTERAGGYRLRPPAHQLCYDSHDIINMC